MKCSKQLNGCSEQLNGEFDGTTERVHCSVGTTGLGGIPMNHFSNTIAAMVLVSMLAAASYTYTGAAVPSAGSSRAGTPAMLAGEHEMLPPLPHRGSARNGTAQTMLHGIALALTCNAGCIPKHMKLKEGKPDCCSKGHETLKCPPPAHYHCGPAPPSPPPAPKCNYKLCSATPPSPPCCFEGHAFEPNTLGSKPTRGWRSWQAYSRQVNQSIMEDIMRGMAKKRPVGPGGKMVSLLDAGYTDVGLDAGYEMIGQGYNGSCHNKEGHMLINKTKFPSFNAMTSTAHSLQLTASWYLNNDPCKGAQEQPVGPTYTQDSTDALKYGFDGVKFDTQAGGPGRNITLWAMALQAAGKANGNNKEVMIENCDDKNPRYLLADPEDCPYNFYRTGPDNSPDFLSQMHHVYGWALPYLSVTHPMPASRPHCWAYPDMLGIGAPVRGTVAYQQARSRGCANLTLDEERTVFANWAIVSSPLVLAIDTTDDDVVAKYYPIVGNKQALDINAAWAGAPGTLFKRAAANRSNTIVTIYAGARCEAPKNMSDPFPKWLVYTKPLVSGDVAALLINLDDAAPAADVQLTLADLQSVRVPGQHSAVGGIVSPPSAPPSYSATDVWTGAEAGAVGGKVTRSSPFTFKSVSPRNSSFVIFRVH